MKKFIMILISVFILSGCGAMGKAFLEGMAEESARAKKCTTYRHTIKDSKHKILGTSFTRICPDNPSMNKTEIY